MMNGSYYSEVDYGKYNFSNREKEITEKLQKELDKFKLQILNSLKTSAETTESHNTSDGQEDLFKVEIDRVKEEIQGFKIDVDKFNGPHFTKQYRALLSMGQNFQFELDKLNLSDNDDLKRQKKDLIVEIDSLIDKVKAKIHKDGKICNECPVSVV